MADDAPGSAPDAEPIDPSLRLVHLRALRAEAGGRWHVAAQCYLEALDRALDTGDATAELCFAGRLHVVYRQMGMEAKAAWYAAWADG